MKKLFVAGLVAAACSAQAVELYNNGTIITASPNLSVLASPNTTLGYSSIATSSISLADDFKVTGAGWNVESLSFFAYQTSAVGFTFTNASWSLVAGTDVNTGTVVASGTTAVTSGGITAYRVTSTTLTSTARAVYRINVDIPDVTLAAGSYWVTWALAGTSASGPFVPPTIATSGNGSQNTGSGYFTVSDTGSLVSSELPFAINGTVVAVPEPSSLALLLAGGLTIGGAVRRRRLG